VALKETAFMEVEETFEEVGLEKVKAITRVALEEMAKDTSNDMARAML
jgi:hypothetical protein